MHHGASDRVGLHRASDEIKMSGVQFPASAMCRKSRANIAFITAWGHPSVMGTWCTDPQLINTYRMHLSPSLTAEKIAHSYGYFWFKYDLGQK